MFKSIINIIIPYLCLTCRAEINAFGLCTNCYKYVELIPDNICGICGHPYQSENCIWCQRYGVKQYLYHRSCVIYKSIIKKMIIDYKENNNRIYSYFFADLMINSIHGIEYDLICAVPLHRWKIFRRGFNQIQNIVNIIAKKYKKEICFLQKTQNTESQKGKTFLERQMNIKNTFYIKEDLNGKKILLIDDVYTTGATLNECSKVLRNAGASDIYAVTIAKVCKDL